MLFSSVVFLLGFLPVVVLVHAALPQRFRNAFLLLASVVFYAYGDARYLPLFLVLALVNYGCALGMEARPRLRGWLTALGVGANVAALAYYKYAALLLPFVTQVPDLPLGISFYVFQSLSYLLDVRAGRTRAERSFLRYAAYIMLFPQLIAGPIVRYTDVAQALRKRTLEAARLEKGMLLFLLGLSSKVLLANRLGSLFDGLMALSGRGTLGTAAALIAYGFQIYYDFAGYSLMAVGLGEMLGFSFPENFRHPYAANSIGDFWRRWHITLGQWLKTYIYIPLGGSRAGTLRTVCNLLITWGLSGLWHGAGFNFLTWGLYFGVLIALEKYVYGAWLRAHPIVAHVYAVCAVMLSWIFFAFGSAAEMSGFVLELLHPVLGENVLFTLQCGLLPLLLSILFAVPAVCGKGYALMEGHALLRCVCMLALLVLCLMELLGAQYNPFLYFRF